MTPKFSASILALVFPVGCGSADDATAAQGTLLNAEKNCAAMATKVDRSATPAPPPGGIDPYTRCMLNQANTKIGTPEFNQICDAVPGSRIDKTGNCFVISM